MLRDLKTGTETEFSKIPGFYSTFAALYTTIRIGKSAFSFDGSLRLAFFDLHLDSTDGDTVLALDFNRPGSDLSGFHPTGPRLFRCRANPPFSHSRRTVTFPSPGQQKDGELLLHRALGQQTEPHSLCAAKIRCALLRHVNVSARPCACGHYVAPKCRLKFHEENMRCVMRLGAQRARHVTTIEKAPLAEKIRVGILFGGRAVRSMKFRCNQQRISSTLSTRINTRSFRSASIKKANGTSTNGVSSTDQRLNPDYPDCQKRAKISHSFRAKKTSSWWRFPANRGWVLWM